MDASNAGATNPLAALSESLAAAVEKVSPAIVAVHARPRVPTSGVLWRPGVIVSTNHTVRRDEDITATRHDGSRLPVTLAGRDPSTDLAVLRFDDAEAGTHAVAAAESQKVGQLVLAVGRVRWGRGVSASLGIVGVVGEEWRTWRGGEIDRLIRPDVSIFVGFSGGALVDAEGNVIGINTTGLARGTGLTVPGATVNRVVDQLLQHGRVARPYLGVGMQQRVALPDDLKNKLGLSQSIGLVILSVEPGAPAALAGITLGDVLIALDGTPVTDTDEVQAALGRSGVGQEVNATIIRGGERRDVKVTLGERPRAQTK